MSAPLQQPNPPPICCHFLAQEPEEKVYQSERAINENDPISNAPDLCIIAIFKHFNHADLDVMSCVSQKMSLFAAKARPKTRRRLANGLDISQNKFDDIVVKLVVDGHRYRMHAGVNGPARFSFAPYDYEDDEEDEDEDYGAEDDDEVDRPRRVLRKVPCCVYDRLHYLSERFDFAIIFFNNILIDDRFLVHCEKIFRPNLEGKIVSRKLDFDDSFSTQDRRKYIDWIVSKKPGELDFDVDLPFYGVSELEFLAKLFRNGNCRKLHMLNIKESRNSPPPSVIPVAMFDELAKFDMFYFSKIVIQADQVMNFILRRVATRKHGYYSVRTTKYIERSKIRSGLGNEEFKEEQHRGQYKIVFPRLNWAVILHQDNGKSKGLTMRFLENKGFAAM